MSLQGKTVLITGAGVRLGRAMALAVACQGGDLVIHYNHSREPAESLAREINAIGRTAHILQADLRNPRRTTQLVHRARSYGSLYALVNNASIFESLSMMETTIEDWERHLAINLTAPFLLSQAFASVLHPNETGRIVNLLDWRALRPGSDHFPYSVSKASLAALTRSMAIALAPRISVNGLALGAILPPSDGQTNEHILDFVPMKRWADLDEVTNSLLFLLDGPTYVTGEIIHIDGGRHLI